MKEEVKVKYILYSLYAELQVQPSTDIQNVLANSVLEFIWKIADHSIRYTTDAYQRKLQLFKVPKAQQSSFDDFVWTFLDQNFQQVWSVANSVLFQKALLGEWGLPSDPQIWRRIALTI